jgi:NAD(P)-dependent dehydrogenase (short-subunit alcohol dehydrogenase family)
MKPYADRVALITGGASGIGAATARRLTAEGARVVITDVDRDRGEALARELGDAARFVAHDVTRESDWEAACAAAVTAFGALHVVVNSAGISVPANVEDATLEHWRTTMAINADGVFLGSKHGVRFIRRFSAATGGAIVNVASTLGARPGAIYVAYSASKAAVLAVTRATALHCAAERTGIRVNAVLPGATRTPMVDRYLANAADADALLRQFESVHPLGRIGRPEDIAAAIAFLASADADWITGVALPVDGGFLAS